MESIFKQETDWKGTLFVEEFYRLDNLSKISPITQVQVVPFVDKNNIAVLRAERYLKPGIHPRFFDLILEKRVSRPIEKYTGLQWKHLLN